LAAWAEGELALRQPEITTYGETVEEVRRFGLPCGGTVQIVLEPLSAGSRNCASCWWPLSRTNACSAGWT
jgi:xanthine/CO dehydrogenase XdhC/CoxF family maturation factor